MSIKRISTLPVASALELQSGIWLPLNTADNITKKALLADILKNGGSGIFAVKTTIPSADALNMGIGDSPVVISPAFGAGTAIELIRASARMNYNSATYATAADLYIGNSLGQPVAWIENFMAATVNTHRPARLLTATGAANEQIIENSALLAYCSVSPTAGDSTIDIYSLLRITQL